MGRASRGRFGTVGGVGLGRTLPMPPQYLRQHPELLLARAAGTPDKRDIARGMIGIQRARNDFGMIEDAGIDANRLVGSRTGVFVGEWVADFEARYAGLATTQGADLLFFD